MGRPKKRITAAQAAKILGTTKENIYSLAKLGLISEVKVCTGRHSTNYYLESEIRERRQAAAETLAVARDTADVLAEVREENTRVKAVRKALRDELRTVSNYRCYREMFSDLLVGALEALRKSYRGDTPRWALARDIAALTPFEDITFRYGITDATVRQWVNRAVRGLRRIPDITEENRALREEAAALRSENDYLRKYVAEHKELEEVAKQLEEAGKESLSAEDLRIRKTLLTNIADYGLSVRAYNCLRARDVETVADLVWLPRLQIMKMRNLGRKSIQELDSLVKRLGLKYDMDIRRYGIKPKETEWYTRYFRKE